MNEPEPLERRRHDRRTVVKRCKIRDRRTASFAAGETADLSAGGALIRVERARPFGPGDEVDLVVDWDGRTVLSSDDMLRARVRRVTPIDHQHQAVALEFKQVAAAAAIAA